MPKRGLLNTGMRMHEKPATIAEIEYLWKLKAHLLSAHDIARLLEWTVNHTPAQSLDRETCDRVCAALQRHGKTAGPSHPPNEGGS